MRNGKKTKRIEAQRAKHQTTSRAIDAFIGDEEQKKQKRKEGSGSPTQLPWSIQSPPTTYRDHTVSLFFLHLSPTPGPQEKHIFIYKTLITNAGTAHINGKKNKI